MFQFISDQTKRSWIKYAFIAGMIVLAAVFLPSKCEFLMPLPDNPIVNSMKNMDADNDPESMRKRAKVIEQFIPYGTNKEESIKLLSEAGFKVSERSERIKEVLMKRGIEVDSVYDFTIRRGFIVTGVYGIRLGYKDKKVVYINAGLAVTGW